MAKGTYERKVLNTHIENFQEQLERSYSQYQEGSYIPVIYYQVDGNKTRVDGSLDVAQNIIGSSSSRKYKKIVGVPMYGISNGINYELEMTETSFKNMSAGQGYLAPGTIKPNSDDFFIIDRQGLKNHLFKVTSIDFNTANANKYYQINFELYQNSASDITGNVSNEYKFIIENMGSNQNTIVKSSDEYLMSKAKDVVDTLIDKYIFSFYDYAYDTFTLKVNSSIDYNNTKIWNPYLIRFIHDKDIITKYKYDLMTEIFVPQYFEGGYELWFKDDVWMDSIYNKISSKQTLTPIDLFTTVDTTSSLTKWIKLPFYQSAETILLDSFANEYTKNYLEVPTEAIITLPEDQKPFFMNLKSLFSKEIYVKGKPTNVSYLSEDNLLELEYFSINAKSIWDSSKTGDMYYVYNNNTGNIDNIYMVVGTPGEVQIGEEEDILEDNRYFNLLSTYIADNKIGKTLCFFDDEMNLKSSWSIMSDGTNKFLGRMDGMMFTGSNIQVSNNIVDIIRNYYNGNGNSISETVLDELKNINIRRDSTESYYLIPLVIFALKEYIDWIQR